MAFIIDSASTSSPSGAPAAAVVNGSAQSFQSDVLEASVDQLVLVDFWAEWCGPCKQLSPILEKVARSSSGRIKLVKIDVEREQALAQQLRIQSIPTVYAFLGGRPVDAFAGAQSESQVQAFVDRLVAQVKLPSDDALEQAEAALNASEYQQALSVFSQVLSEDPSNPRVIAGLIRSLVGCRDLQQAKRLVAGLPADLAKHADISAATTALELAEQSQAGDTRSTTLRQQLAATPDDMQCRFDLANALYAEQHVEAAVDELLALIRTDRSWNDEAARKQIVKIFEALGPKHPLTVQARRRLSATLFS